MNPGDDWFLTTARDNTLRLWNLEATHCGPEAELDLTARVAGAYPVACFDNKGIIFAVAFTEQAESAGCRICLYDKSKF